MGFTFDHVLAVLRGTVLHPGASLLIPGTMVAFKLVSLPLRTSDGLDSVEWVAPVSTSLRASLYIVCFSWVLQLNRLMNRKALNPAPAGEYRWPKEVAVITGGSGGVGAELVQKLEKLGTTIVVLDVIPLTFKPAAKTHYMECNIASLTDVQAAYQDICSRHGTPTVLVANAGVVIGRTIIDKTEADVRKTFDVNVLGVLWCVKTFIPAMIKANHGHVLVTSSTMSFVTVPNVVDYSASKAAVTSIVEGLQAELKHHYGNPSVACSAVFPGLIATKMFKGIDASSGNKFMLPTLQPEQVAERMFHILMKGESEMAMLPSMSNTSPWMRVLPTWMRVMVQDAGSHSMDHLTPGG